MNWRDTIGEEIFKNEALINGTINENRMEKIKKNRFMAKKVSFFKKSQ